MRGWKVMGCRKSWMALAAVGIDASLVGVEGLEAKKFLFMPMAEKRTGALASSLIAVGLA